MFAKRFLLLSRRVFIGDSHNSFQFYVKPGLWTSAYTKHSKILKLKHSCAEDYIKDNEFCLPSELEPKQLLGIVANHYGKMKIWSNSHESNKTNAKNSTNLCLVCQNSIHQVFITKHLDSPEAIELIITNVSPKSK